MTEPLPVFTYLPDPIGSGSVERSEGFCRACGQARGYLCVAGAYGELVEPDDLFCPWCVADGSVYAAFDCYFNDPWSMDGFGTAKESVPREVLEEIEQRTPRFIGWQETRWLCHCSDACEFLGLAGYKELTARWPEAIPVIQADIGYVGAKWEDYLRGLDAGPEGSPTAYMFRCRHCGAVGGYSDFH